MGIEDNVLAGADRTVSQLHPRCPQHVCSEVARWRGASSSRGQAEAAMLCSIIQMLCSSMVLAGVSVSLLVLPFINLTTVAQALLEVHSAKRETVMTVHPSARASSEA